MPHCNPYFSLTQYKQVQYTVQPKRQVKCVTSEQNVTGHIYISKPIQYSATSLGLINDNVTYGSTLRLANHSRGRFYIVVLKVQKHN